MLFDDRVLLDIAREKQHDWLAEAEAFRLAQQLRGDGEIQPKAIARLAGRVGHLLIAAGTRLHTPEAENLQVCER